MHFDELHQHKIISPHTIFEWYAEVFGFRGEKAEFQV